MLVGKNKPVSYFSLNEHRGGSLRTKDRDTDKEDFFDWIEGYLVEVRADLENKYQGKPDPKFYFKFESYDRKQVGILQIGEAASACRGLLASLVTIPEPVIRQIYVRPYTSTTKYEDGEATFVNVDVSYRSSQSDSWIRLIELEETRPLYKSIFQNMPKEDGPRREYILRMCKKVNERLQSSEAADSINGVPPKNEYVDQHGEVHQGKPDPAADLYTEPDDSEPPLIKDSELPF